MISGCQGETSHGIVSIFQKPLTPMFRLKMHLLYNLSKFPKFDLERRRNGSWDGVKDDGDVDGGEDDGEDENDEDMHSPTVLLQAVHRGDIVRRHLVVKTLISSMRTNLTMTTMKMLVSIKCASFVFFSCFHFDLISTWL